MKVGNESGSNQHTKTGYVLPIYLVTRLPRILDRSLFFLSSVESFFSVACGPLRQLRRAALGKLVLATGPQSAILDHGAVEMKDEGGR